MTLGILLAQTCFGQQNYLPGYIVSLKGDTISGFVDYRNWEYNPDKIYFQNELGDAQALYTPTDINGFGVQDEIYVSAIVRTEISASKTNELSYSSEAIFAVDTTFLQTIISGPKSLFYYKIRHGKEQFYSRQDGVFDLLVYKRYLKKRPGGDAVAENRKYLGQLALYLQDCPLVQSKLGNTRYGKEGLSKLFAFYYHCTGSTVKFQKETEKVTTEVGALIGATSSSLEFKSNSYAYLTDVDYPHSLNISAGLFFDVIFPRNAKKWSLYNELMYTSYQMEGRYDSFTNENTYSTSYIKIGYSYIKMNNLARFRYPVGNLQIYLNGGMSNGFVVAETNFLRKESTTHSINQVEEGRALNEVRKYEQGYLIGIGSKFKKYSLEIRYEKGSGVSLYRVLGSSVHRYYLLLGYKF